MDSINDFHLLDKLFRGIINFTLNGHIYVSGTDLVANDSLFYGINKNILLLLTGRLLN